MIIVLEGNEGAGKTTLTSALEAEWLKRAEGNIFNMIHVGAPPSWDPGEFTADEWQRARIDELLSMVNSFSNDPQELNVFDRFHWGSPIYGHLYRPKLDGTGFGDLGRSGFLEVEYALHAKGAVTALLLPSLSTIHARSVGRVDEYLDEVEGASDRREQLRKIHEAYISLVVDGEHFLPTYLGHPVNYDSSTKEEVFHSSGQYFFPPSLLAEDGHQGGVFPSITLHPKRWPEAAGSEDPGVVAGYLITAAKYAAGEPLENNERNQLATARKTGF